MRINESVEDYLERILILENENGFARSVDVAAGLNVTKPSVSHATKLLRENGYIDMDAQSRIRLTPAGREIAERTYERHTLLASFLTRLGVSPETAARDACRMEHYISAESFTAICRHAGRERG